MRYVRILRPFKNNRTHISMYRFSQQGGRIPLDRVFCKFCAIYEFMSSDVRESQQSVHLLVHCNWFVFCIVHVSVGPDALFDHTLRIYG